MPYTLKTQQISVKDPDSGEYIGVDVLAEQNKESLIAEIQSEGDLQVERVDQKAAEILAAGDAQVTRINQTGTNVQTLVNNEEARAQQIVTDAQTSLNTLEAQKNTIAETVASMAELGTDTTLTTPGMAADAKAVGDVKSEVDNLGDFVYDQDSGLSTKAPAITDSASSGDIVTFESDVEGGLVSKLTGTIEPIQDLHGYDYPWPGGGGKNLAPPVVGGSKYDVTCTVNSDGSVILNGTASNNAAFYSDAFTLKAGTYKSNGVPSGGSGNYVFYLEGVTGSANTGGDIQITVSEDVITRSVVQVYSGGTANNITMQPMLRLATETDDTYAPYSNICPITGYTEANVSATGINVWDEEWEVGQYRPNTGEKADNANNIRSKNFIPCKPNTTYCFTWGGWSDWAEQVLFYNADYSFITGANKSFGLLPATFTTPATAYYMTFFVGGVSTYNHNISINYPATDTAYHPYAGSTIPITFPTEAGTVYSGTINPISGKLKSNLAMVSADDLEWHVGGSSNQLLSATIVGAATTSIFSMAEYYQYQIASPNVLPPNAYTIVNSTIYLHPNGGSTVYGNFLYSLATPIEYQCTPAEVKTLLGTNNIWLDTGSITECVYPKDTKKYIDNKSVVKAPVIINNAEGDIASFTDGAEDMPVKSLVASIEPVQDLNGYEYPWPAGGGVNLCALTENTQTINGVTFTVNSDGTITMNGTATASANFIMGTVSLPSDTYILNAFVELPSGCTINAASHGTRQATEFTDAVDGNVFLYVASGTVVSNVVVKPSLYLKSVGMPTFQPYANICPISGHTGLTVARTGVNLFDKTTAISGYIDDANGELNPIASYKSTDFIRVVGGNTYYVKTEQALAAYGAWYDKNKNFIRGITQYINASVTAPDNAAYVRLTIASPGSGNVDTFGFNYPSTDTAYHAYTGATIPITWETEAGTVYGGNLTLNPDRTGTLVVDRAMVDMGTLAWTVYNGLFLLLYAPIPGMRTGNGLDGICSTYPLLIGPDYSWINLNDKQGVLYYGGGQTRIGVRDSDYLTSVEFAASVAGQTCVYPLAEPQTYQLTTTEVSGVLETLYGTNNVWTDVGSVSVDYPADTKLFIQNAIAEALSNSSNP